MHQEQPLVIHGDVEALIIEILENTSELQPYSPTIATDLRNYETDSGLNWIMVTAEGGAHTVFNVINKPRIDIEVRAGRRDIAHQITQICIGSIYRSVPYAAYGAFLSDIKTELGPVNVPDKEEEESYRYLFALRAVCTVDPDSAPGAQSS